ncbi:Transcriptional regulatory protein OmpR [Luteitalea pratensis]|uniref:Transcriptional regulatory protein OmpR n=1 Tax=Luteitalea pratensis TaxID=1855912 RepID=A0A143PMN1_LUTPR|nr:transcriptional regulator [Luteitalea pratensis]AMY09338.1 Transcriptional regulatory protein OmpR [Luteitalea pratensis]
MPGPVSSVYAFGPFRLDVSQRTLTHENRPVALQPKTFDLLHLLVSNPGRALSKQELMAALWSEAFVEESNLAFQISALRKALRSEPTQWIETVSRYGYRFAADVVSSFRALANFHVPL